MADDHGWPDPARPGVPPHPERNGWHWVADPDMPPDPLFWRAFDARWIGWTGQQTAPEHIAYAYHYFGPALLPAEVAAAVAQARREEREACAAICATVALPEDISAVEAHGRMMSALAIREAIRARAAEGAR